VRPPLGENGVAFETRGGQVAVATLVSAEGAPEYQVNHVVRSGKSLEEFAGRENVV
jgi:hypothetical protein